MNPNIAANQQRMLLGFLTELRPHFRRDSGLPRRIKELLARHRSIGSRDRKLYRELIYTAVRFLPWVENLLASAPETAAKIVAWLTPELKPTALYRAVHCGDWPPVPIALAEKATVLGNLLNLSFAPADLLPRWFHEHCPAAFASPHLDAINSRASIWVRLQTQDPNLVLHEFRAQGWNFEVAADLPDAICLPPNVEVANTDAYRRGFVEIQDLGSQLVLAHAAVPPGGRWLDACAGAGGKTLQLARLIGPEGKVEATDLRLNILEELRDRAQRARLNNIVIVEQATGQYDGVLVDAPCSGSGTWRRQPHLKWYMQAAMISVFAATQLEILSAHAHRVRIGGRLVYATCSLSHCENQDVVAAFVRLYPEFSPESPSRNFGGEFDGAGITLLPGTRNSDGFYVATLRRAR